MRFAINYMSWKEKWHKIICSDENKFNLDSSDGWSHYWHDLRTESKIFRKGQSKAGSIAYLKELNLIFVNHTMNAEYYQQMVGLLFPPLICKIMVESSASIKVNFKIYLWTRHQFIRTWAFQITLKVSGHFYQGKSAKMAPNMSQRNNWKQL